MKGVNLLLYFVSTVIIIGLSFFTIMYILKISNEVNTYIIRADATRKAELLFNIYTHDRRFSTQDGVLEGSWLEENDARKLYIDLYNTVASKDPFTYVDKSSFNPTSTTDPFDPKKETDNYVEFSAVPIGYCEYDYAMFVTAKGIDKEWYIGNIRLKNHMKSIDLNSLDVKFPDLDAYKPLEFYSLVDLSGVLYPATVKIVVFDEGSKSKLLCLFAKAKSNLPGPYAGEMVAKGDKFIIKDFEIKTVGNRKYATFVWHHDPISGQTTTMEWRVFRDVSYMADFPDLTCKEDDITKMFIHKSWNKNDQKRQLRIEWDASKGDFCGNWKNDNANMLTCKGRVNC